MTTENTAHGGTVQTAPGIGNPPLALSGWVLFPPFAGWHGDMNDHLPRFHSGQELPAPEVFGLRAPVSGGMVELDGARYRVDCPALVNWQDGMRVISPSASTHRARAELVAAPDPADRLDRDAARAADLIVAAFERRE
jgi:hypothetical protein